MEGQRNLFAPARPEGMLFGLIKVSLVFNRSKIYQANEAAIGRSPK